MRRADKFLLRPTSTQAQALSEMLRDHCSLYNGALGGTPGRLPAWVENQHPLRGPVGAA